MKYPWLRAGVKVVCVDARDRAARGNWYGDRPTKGSTYTVTGVGESLQVSGQTNIWLAEIDNGPYGYDLSRFRPLHDTSKQIEAMRNLMLDATVRGKVDA